jgi:hypothetical protein
LDLLKSASNAGSKDHTEASTSNINKEELSANDQQRFEDFMKEEKEEVLRRCTKWREMTKEKYLSHFMVDHCDILAPVDGDILIQGLINRVLIPTRCIFFGSLSRKNL